MNALTAAQFASLRERWTERQRTHWLMAALPAAVMANVFGNGKNPVSPEDLIPPGLRTKRPPKRDMTAEEMRAMVREINKALGGKVIKKGAKNG